MTAPKPELQITPEILEFHPPYTRVITNTIKLTNPSQDRYVCFKIKTTSPKRYTVRPSGAIIPPLETYSVQVTLNMSKEPITEAGKDRDRFQIQSIFVPVEISSVDIKTFDPKNLWNEIPADEIMKYRLKTRKFITSGAPLGNLPSSTPSDTHGREEEEASGIAYDDKHSPISSPRDSKLENKSELGTSQPSSSDHSIQSSTTEASTTDPNSNTSSPSSSPYSSVLGDSSLSDSSLTDPSTTLPPVQPVETQKESLNNRIEELSAQYKRSGLEVGGGLSFRQRQTGSSESKDKETTSSKLNESSPLSQPSVIRPSMVKQKQEHSPAGWSTTTLVIVAVLFFLLGQFAKF